MLGKGGTEERRSSWESIWRVWIRHCCLGEPHLLSFQALEMRDFTPKGSETKGRFTSETINHSDFSY